MGQRTSKHDCLISRKMWIWVASEKLGYPQKVEGSLWCKNEKLGWPRALKCWNMPICTTDPMSRIDQLGEWEWNLPFIAEQWTREPFTRLPFLDQNAICQVTKGRGFVGEGRSRANACCRPVGRRRFGQLASRGRGRWIWCWNKRCRLARKRWFSPCFPVTCWFHLNLLRHIETLLVDKIWLDPVSLFVDGEKKTPKIHLWSPWFRRQILKGNWW